MSTSGGAYRWWENYLVRYLMPSIAGAVIVNWLAEVGGGELRHLLLLNTGAEGLQAPTMLLLFLYGNLFCYIASYPVLGFHVTRVVDFSRGAWRHQIWDGYLSTLFVAAVVLLVSQSSSTASCWDRATPFLIAILFTGLQLVRLFFSLEKIPVKGLKDKTSKVFAYAYAISKRRGVAEELRITKKTTKEQEDEDTGEKFDEEIERQRHSKWQKEFIDTYRHMREHGNSAFIFVLELTLAGLVFLVLRSLSSHGALAQLSAVGIIFAIWALPAMFVHLVGQHIEYRFSWYDRKLNKPEDAENQ